MRVFNKGKCQVKGYSEDYAFFIQALIDLYEATFEIDWLKEADDLNERMIHQFWDERNGGFFFTGKENESLIARSKNPYDNAIPSANSVAVFNLMRLGYLTGEESLKQKAEQISTSFITFFQNILLDLPTCYPASPSFSTRRRSGSSVQRTIKDKIHAQEIYLAYLPNKILSLKDPQEPIEGNWFPFLKEKGGKKFQPPLSAKDLPACRR